MTGILNTLKRVTMMLIFSGVVARIKKGNNLENIVRQINDIRRLSNENPLNVEVDRNIAFYDDDFEELLSLLHGEVRKWNERFVIIRDNKSGAEYKVKRSQVANRFDTNLPNEEVLNFNYIVLATNYI